jgi:hypothetical protein
VGKRSQKSQLEQKKKMSNDDNIVKMSDHLPRQQTPQELAEWFLDRAKKTKVKRAFVLWLEEGEQLHSFGVGSSAGNYTNADINYDLDQFKFRFMIMDYEPVDD